MQTLKLLIFFNVGIFLFSCGNFVDKKSDQSAIDLSAQDDSRLDFSTVKQTIFAARCISCHQQYSNYQGVVRELNAIQSAVASNRMPKSGGPLTDNQKAILAAWISQGAPDQIDGTMEPNLPESLAPTWNSLSENVIVPKCLVCHNPQGQAKFLDLSNRQAIFNARNRIYGGEFKFLDFENPDNSYLMQVLNDQEEPMPPVWSNIPRLTIDELKTIKQWISLGLP
jgi:hypothetical protein